jgi:hypothetical protein
MARPSGRSAFVIEPTIHPIEMLEGAMTRQLFSFRVAATVLVWTISTLAASAIEMPTRKAGLWEMKMVRTGSPMPDMTMQHCTDETTDKAMSSFSSTSKDICSKNDIQKTATGYTTDSVCTVSGMSVTSHSETTGDFNSAYTVKVTSHSQGGPSGPRDTVMTVEAKWVGACKADQKPGDIVMPGGRKMNVKDMEKMKAMAPK